MVDFPFAFMSTALEEGGFMYTAFLRFLLVYTDLHLFAILHGENELQEGEQCLLGSALNES